ncbi:hypothetical protein [Compostibacter hankyongensis]|uniref:Uncharacterized protein n=1 Tax=Compostibacter hankyongensis TaxID=1007089 RepID=A0ABP8FED2_9BACT
MNRMLRKLLLSGCILGLASMAYGQTNTVEFGQNRLQYKNFKWRYLQTGNFNTYFNQNGLELGKYVAQAAEAELNDIEKTMDYGLRRRINIVVYNSFGEMKQSNIGIGLDWQNTGGTTKLVNNKMIVYFDGDHAALRRQIREGIARVIFENMLMGDNFGEFAGNTMLLNLPIWYTDGYIAYIAENWNTELDGDLKEALYSGRYRTFNQLALEKPTLAGHAFWYYVENKYGKDATSYLLYISRMERSLKKASTQVLHQKFKNALQDFMTYNYRRYQDDNRHRRQITRGRPVTTRPTDERHDYYRFHPNPRNRDYAMVEFKKGKYSVLLYQGAYKPKVLLTSGVRQLQSQVNPDYPQIAWDTKGGRLAVIYEERGKLKLMIYDLISRTRTHQDLPADFQSINSFQYLLDHNTLLLSAVKNGHSDIYTYNISTFQTTPITQDVYDDLDPSFVAFPGKSGVIFSSNRPSAYAKDADTVLPHDHYNVFLIDNWNKTQDKQISRLTEMQHGDARMPTQYNDTYFTFVSDDNGIRNRYAGFFRATQDGLDSLYFVGTDIYHNPEPTELDSALQAYGSTQPDSVKVIAITQDSTYVFPITNYIHGIVESNIAGDQMQVSETIRQGDFKRVYRLRTDTIALRRRNVSTPLTTYRRYSLHKDSIARGLPMYYEHPDTTQPEQGNYFQSEFGYEPPDSNIIIKENETLTQSHKNILKSARLLPYHLKFSSDYLVAQLDNSVLINRYQPFMGGGGPIYLQQPFNGMIQVGVSDLFENIKFFGGFRVPSNLNGSEYFFGYENLTHLVDWKAVYYRKVDRLSYSDGSGNPTLNEGKLKTNLYQITARYPFDPVRSVRLTLGYRTDQNVFLAKDPTSLPKGPLDYTQTYGLLRLEYVYDNTTNPAMNIWNGLRYKVYGELFPELKGPKKSFTFNAGADARYYLPIYKNFIWATRVAADFSWGDRRLLYYLGGVDNWLFPKYDATVPVNHAGDNPPYYAYQTLAENLRGYPQNVKNGTNVLLLNTELRLPVFATFIEQPINSNFIRNFQLTAFADIGTAWNEKLSFKNEGYSSYPNVPTDPTVILQIKNNFLGPFAGGYGFGARTALGGYFLRLDAAWPMTGLFEGKPMWYLALGVDF